jgi:hypothetical protein
VGTDVNRARLGIIVAMTIATLILAKGVGLAAFVFYKWLRLTAPALARFGENSRT